MILEATGILIRFAQWRWLCLIFFGVAACAQNTESKPELSLDNINLPPGFEIEIVADVSNARSLVLSDAGTLFVSSQRIGKVHAVQNVLGEQPQVIVIATGLRYPNGVAFKDGNLYIAEPERVLRFSDIESHLDAPGDPETLFEGLRAGRQHSWKYIAFGPDEKLYVGIGSPCNVCDEPDYGLIQRMHPDGTEIEVVARGIRNSVGFDWHPETGELWFTDNNRDRLGDNKPPGELNRVARTGEHFGFPFCHGAAIVEPDKEFAVLGNCAESSAPAQLLGAHVAPLGMAFYDAEQFPPEYRNQIFIAEHGSWNRSDKIGYRISLVTISGSRGVEYKSFAEGWLQGKHTTGRPVDVIVAADGSLLVSDDYAGKIYRITYVGSKIGQ